MGQATACLTILWDRLISIHPPPPAGKATTLQSRSTNSLNLLAYFDAARTGKAGEEAGTKYELEFRLQASSILHPKNWENVLTSHDMI